MRDLIDKSGFRHLSPRRRLLRHARNRAWDRLHVRLTDEELELISYQCERGVPLRHEMSRELHELTLRGKTVYAVFDRPLGAVVTFFAEPPHEGEQANTWVKR